MCRGVACLGCLAASPPSPAGNVQRVAACLIEFIESASTPATTNCVNDAAFLRVVGVFPFGGLGIAANARILLSDAGNTQCVSEATSTVDVCVANGETGETTPGR